MDRLLDPFTLAGAARPVARARHDWQVYDPRRASKGGVRWHTVEGSFVLKRKGRYYHMFSGGNWQNVSYGVSYAVADDLAAADEWAQHADGDRVLPILRTVPGEVIGPGHNSVVRGPDNRQLFCVYHRWAPDSSARVLSIDRLEWAGDRLLVLGPTTAPQPAPLPPTVAGFGSGEFRAVRSVDEPVGLGLGVRRRPLVGARRRGRAGGARRVGRAPTSSPGHALHAGSERPAAPLRRRGAASTAASASRSASMFTCLLFADYGAPSLAVGRGADRSAARLPGRCLPSDQAGGQRAARHGRAG